MKDVLHHIRSVREGDRKEKVSQEAGTVENGCGVDIGTDWRMSPHPGTGTRSIFIAGFQNGHRLAIERLCLPPPPSASDFCGCPVLGRACMLEVRGVGDLSIGVQIKKSCIWS